MSATSITSIEPLESRIAPAAFVVNTIADRTDSAGSTIVSLRDAITLANASTDATNTITFAANVHGIMHLKSPLPAITDNLTITGPGATKLTIDGGNKIQVLYLGNSTGSGFNITLSNLGFAHGKAAPGGVIGNGAAGGAIEINDYNGTVLISHCTISGSTAQSTNSTYAAKGGGIYVAAGTVTLTGSTVTGNTAKGAPEVSGYTAGGNAQGGGIYVNANATLSIQGSVISGNKALGANGMAGAKAARVKTGYAGGNGYAGGYGGNAYGGGIFNAGTLTIATSTVSGNSAIGGAGGNGSAGGRGGAASRSYAPGNGGNGGYGGNGGSASGGGIGNMNALSLTVSSSTISGNTAAGGVGGKAGPGGKAGHGVQHANGTSYRGTPGTAGNAGSAGGSGGGGIESYYSYATLQQVTIAGNTAGSGGGIDFNQNKTSEVDNSTIAFNTSLTGGGGIFVTLDGNSDAVNLMSTVVAKNTAPTTRAGMDISGTVSMSSSFIESTAGATLSGFYLSGQDPLLGNLANNGGPTQTILPSATSPLIDMGINTDGFTLDQRGDPRVMGSAIDIGAVEVA